MKDTAQSETNFSQAIDFIMRRRWILIAVSVIVFLSVALVTFSTKPLYQASTLVVIEKERGGNAVFANGAMVDAANDDYYQTQYRLLQSDSLTQRVYDELGLESHPEFRMPRGLQKLHDAIVINPVMRSRLVYIKTKSHDPKIAADIANTLAREFVQQNLSNQLFISKEILQALQLERSDAAARRVYDSLPAVVGNSLIQKLKADYVNLQSEAADLAKRYTAKHPASISIAGNLRVLKDQIDAETDKIVQSMKTELSGQLKGNNVRIVDPAAVPDRPFKPRKGLALVFGLLAGLTAGLCVAYLVELLDQSIRTQEDVESRLSLPFLGQVPHYDHAAQRRPQQILLSPEASLTSEAFKNLRTMVDFALVSDKSSTLLVTSSVQEEGKTYVASSLAIAFAQLGEKVLLIDGDLRRPNVHRTLELSSSKGLSNYLAGGDSVNVLESMLQETSVPGLSALACGPRPPNPSELLNTPRVSALVAWAQERFDRVIVDCTPMFPISDTLLWGRHVRSAIFVTRYGTTRSTLIRNAAQRLESGGVKILGAVVNGAKASGLSYASYGYYYQQYYHSYGQPQPSEKA